MTEESSQPLLAAQPHYASVNMTADEKGDAEANKLAVSESTALLNDAPPRTEPGGRVLSLDQFRGFVVLYSFILPMLGALDLMPPVFKHMNSFFSLQDATMPMFYVAIGFAMQLTLGKLLRRSGFRVVALKQIKRSWTLFIIGMVYNSVDGFESWYGDDGMQQSWYTIFWRPWFFTTLTIIPVAQLVILPVIGRPWATRAAYAVVLAVLYSVGQYYFWFEYMFHYADGGLFGTLSWGWVMLVGSFLDDFITWARRDRKARGLRSLDRASLKQVGLGVAVLLLGAGALMGAGVAYTTIRQDLSPVCFDLGTAGRPAVPCAPYGIVNVPFVMPDPPYISMFSMSQWSSSFSMQAFGAGWGVLVYTVFYVLADELGAAWSLLTVLSQNALLHYMLRDFVFTFIRDIFPSDAPLWMICVLVPLSLLLNLSLAYYLKRNSLYLRV